MPKGSALFTASSSTPNTNPLLPAIPVLMRMDHTEGIAGLLARYVSLRRTPETINRLYGQYARVSAEDLRRVAQKYFVEANRVTALLRSVA